MEQVIMAGFGGQGILSMGRFIASAGLHEGKNVSWLPSYGPEMRGGTANCNVIVSEEPVGSPIISCATALIAMNRPSLEKFESYVEENGVIITDSTLITVKPERKDIRLFEIPATKLADEMNNATFAGIILLGKLIKETGIVTTENFEKALYTLLPPKKHGLIPDEMKALMVGYNY